MMVEARFRLVARTHCLSLKLKIRITQNLRRVAVFWSDKPSLTIPHE
jgi:hypothetical protein